MTTHLPDLTPYAQGAYQRDLLAGRESWSGSTLRGSAAKWGARYAESRRGLLERIEKHPGIARARVALVVGRSLRERRRLLVQVDPEGSWFDYVSELEAVAVLDSRGRFRLASSDVAALPVGWTWADGPPDAPDEGAGGFMLYPPSRFVFAPSGWAP